MHYEEMQELFIGNVVILIYVGINSAVLQDHGCHFVFTVHKNDRPVLQFSSIRSGHINVDDEKQAHAFFFLGAGSSLYIAVISSDRNSLSSTLFTRSISFAPS